MRAPVCLHVCVCARVCIPVMCWESTSLKSGLKLPPSNTSHPSVAMRPAITGALPPTAHLFPGKSRDASTSSLNKVSFSTKRLQDKEIKNKQTNKQKTVTQCSCFSCVLSCKHSERPLCKKCPVYTNKPGPGGDNGRD